MRYVGNVIIPAEFRTALKEKQGGAKERAKALRENVLITAEQLLGAISERDRLLLLIGLYWGEGTKRDFSIINSDPMLLKTFLQSLSALNVAKDRISLSLRIHNDISVLEAKVFWSDTLEFPVETINRIEIIEGKKKGKLPHGMCRIRIRSGIRERLLIQSAIRIIGKSSQKKLLSI